MCCVAWRSRKQGTGCALSLSTRRAWWANVATLDRRRHCSSTASTVTTLLIIGADFHGAVVATATYVCAKWAWHNGRSEGCDRIHLVILLPLCSCYKLRQMLTRDGSRPKYLGPGPFSFLHSPSLPFLSSSLAFPSPCPLLHLPLPPLPSSSL